MKKDNNILPMTTEPKQSTSVIHNMLSKYQQQKDERPFKVAKEGAFFGAALSFLASCIEYNQKVNIYSPGYRMIIDLEARKRHIPNALTVGGEAFKTSKRIPRMFFSAVTFGAAGYFLGNRVVKKKIEREQNSQMDVNPVAISSPKK